MIFSRFHCLCFSFFFLFVFFFRLCCAALLPHPPPPTAEAPRKTLVELTFSRGLKVKSSAKVARQKGKLKFWNIRLSGWSSSSAAAFLCKAEQDLGKLALGEAAIACPIGGGKSGKNGEMWQKTGLHICCTLDWADSKTGQRRAAPWQKKKKEMQPWMLGESNEMSTSRIPVLNYLRT